MTVVTECMYRHTECICVCIYTYIKDICFSVYCYVYVLMYFLLQEIVPSGDRLHVSFSSEVCMLLCAFVCVRKMFSDLTFRIKIFQHSNLCLVYVGTYVQPVTAVGD